MNAFCVHLEPKTAFGGCECCSSSVEQNVEIEVHVVVFAMYCICFGDNVSEINEKQENRAVAPRDAAAVLFGLKFTDNIHYKFKISQASKVRLQSFKHTSAKQNLTQNDHSRSFKVTFWSQ